MTVSTVIPKLPITRLPTGPIGEFIESIAETLGQKLGWGILGSFSSPAAVEIPTGIEQVTQAVTNPSGFTPMNPMDHVDKFLSNTSSTSPPTAGGGTDYYQLAVAVAIVCGLGYLCYRAVDSMSEPRRAEAERLSKREDVRNLVHQRISALTKKEQVELKREFSKAGEALYQATKRSFVPPQSAAFAAMKIARE